MIFNHRREKVRDHRDGTSLCPQCDERLVAKRPDLAIWHWAHWPSAAGRTSCPWQESDWHLAWKDVFMARGWTIEHPVVVESKKYILDAFRLATSSTGTLPRAWEFVHSLSPYYSSKHQALMRSGISTSWLIDGGEFVSERRKVSRRGDGWVGLLKPTAHELACHVSARVHYENVIFKQWKDKNVWFEDTSNHVVELETAFAERQLAPVGTSVVVPPPDIPIEDPMDESPALRFIRDHLTMQPKPRDLLIWSADKVGLSAADVDLALSLLRASPDGEGNLALPAAA